MEKKGQKKEEGDKMADVRTEVRIDVRTEAGKGEEIEVGTGAGIKAVLQDLPVRLPLQETIETAAIEACREQLGQSLLASIARAGAAETQEEYEQAYDAVFAELDRLDAELGEKQYLLGDIPTQADVRLYSVLVRFDIIYYFAFRLNRNQIKDFPNLWRYAVRLYHRQEFQAVTDFQKLKEDYYQNQTDIENPYHLVANGPDVSAWEEMTDND